MNDLLFPQTGVGTHQPERILRDFKFNDYNTDRDLIYLSGDRDIVDAHRLETDFDRYDANEWSITTTEAGAGAATEAVVDIANGALYVLNDSADDDSDELVWKVKTFNLKAAFRLYLELRFKVSDYLQTDLWFGLVDTVLGYFGGGVQNGVYFTKADGSAALYAVNEDGNVASATAMGLNIASLTWYRLGIHWDGAGNIRFFVFTDGVRPQVCAAVQKKSTYVPDDAADALAPGFGIRNGEAAAKGLWIDYLKVVQYRLI